MNFRKAVCYSLSLSEKDPLAYLRLIAPLRQSGIEIINGIENHQVYVDRVLDGDFVIVQREFPRDFTNYKKITKIARLEGKPVVFDIDDLLFYLPENHPDRHSGRYGLSLLPMFQALIEADLVSVTTTNLRTFVTDYNEKVAILPNYLDDNLWQIKQKKKKNSNEGPLTIGYMGGITHKPDLEYLIPVFLEIHKRYPDRVRFRFWGVQPPGEILSFPQVEWFPSTSNNYEDFAKYFQTQTADIFITPLIDTKFNRCKSPIKFLEYSALGVPGVYSRLETYTDVITHGYNGFLAYSHDEWINCLVELIEDDQLRSHLANNALDTTRSNWLLSNNYTVWLEAYESAFVNASSKRRNEEKIENVFTSINQQLYETHKYSEFVLSETSLKLFENEAKVSDLMSMVAKRDQEVQSLNNQLIEMENTTQGLSMQVKDNEEKAQIFHREIAEKEKAILEFSTQVKDGEKRVQTLNREISEKQKTVRELLMQVKDDENKIQALNRRITEKEKEVQQFINKVYKREKELEEINSSKAWKIALFIRRIRILLAPPASHRSRVVQRFTHFLKSPFFRNEKVMEEMTLIRSSELFDEKYYLAHNPDIAQAKIDPVFHYLRHGGFEGRDPGPNFSSNWYLMTYPDVKDTGLNPLIHYIKYGKEEGRIPLTNDNPQLTANLFVNKQTPQNISLFEKVVHTWKEGGIRLVWQKTRQKVRWVLKKQHLISAQRQLDSVNDSLPDVQVNSEDLHDQPLICSKSVLPLLGDYYLRRCIY